MKEISKPLMIIVESKGKVFAKAIRRDGKILSGETEAVKGEGVKPEIGAIIALCKAFGHDAAETCYDVMHLLAGAYKVKVRQRGSEPVDYTGHSLGRLAKRTATADKLALRNGAGSLVGRPGEETMFKDVNGKMLFVGDLVTVTCRIGDERGGYKWEAAPGLHYVVDAGDGAFVMGILPACNAETGKISREFRVKLAKRWQEVEVGEEHDSVTAVVEEADDE